MSTCSSSYLQGRAAARTSSSARDAACGGWGSPRISWCAPVTRSNACAMFARPWRPRSCRGGGFSMLTPREELVRSWLVKALHDLATARKAASEPDPYLDTAIYHCQQAGEKAVKGFLAFHDEPPPRTHDIELLLGLAIPREGGFASWLDAAERLTRYATQFRYPGLVMEPSRDEFDQAMADAEGLYRFVLDVLPSALHPNP